jgi:hypothetical protein
MGILIRVFCQRGLGGHDDAEVLHATADRRVNGCPDRLRAANQLVGEQNDLAPIQLGDQASNKAPVADAVHVQHDDDCERRSHRSGRAGPIAGPPNGHARTWDEGRSTQPAIGATSQLPPASTRRPSTSSQVLDR